MGSIYLSRGAKGDTNRGEMGSITPTPTAEERAVLTLAVVLTAAPTTVKSGGKRLYRRPKNGQHVP